MKIKPVPEGFHTITPYLAVHGVSKLIGFMQQAFNAQEIHRHTMPDGRVMNATVRIGDSMLMLGERSDNAAANPAMLYLYVEDCDSEYRRAVAAGGKSIMEPVDQFYGDRSGAVEDAAGNQWWIATHIEDMSDEELIARAKRERM